MIRNRFIIMVLSVATLLFGCDSYLDVDAPSAFDSNYVFSNPADAQKVLFGAYARFAQDPFTSRQSNVWHQNTDVECIGVSANPDGSRRDIWSLQGGLLSSFGDVKSAWDNNYLALDRANQCVEGILASEMKNNAEMQQLLGEAYCLRAFYYYMMCGFWGDVPYFREAAKGGMELDVPKTDKNIIFSMTIQDLVDIEEKMYWAKNMSNGTERMNREFAIGMIARLALFRAGYGMTKDGTMKRAEDYLDMNNDSLKVTYTLNGVTKTAVTSNDYYQLAKDYSLLLIDSNVRKLDTDFHQIFKNQCQYVKVNDGDILYEVGFLAANGGDVGWCVGWPVTGGSYGSTTIQVNFNTSYLYLFDDHDSRMEATVARVSYNNETDQSVLGPTALASAKWNRLWMKTSMGQASSKGTGINWPLMRYSDVYLMLAEAENALNGPTDLAKNALATVRKRAFGQYASEVDTYIAEKATSKEAFFNMVVDERALEFGGECLRKFDLVRWNIYGKKIIETKKMLADITLASFDIKEPSLEKYANYADVVYYKKINGTIHFLNPRYRLPVEQVPTTTVDAASLTNDGTTFAKINWCKTFLSNVTIGGDGTYTFTTGDYLLRSWRGYTDPTGQAAVPYLIPVPASKVANSKYLNNDGYGHVTQ
jgi:starch-binding outer membrane protein, SusD/RagB family